MYGILLMEVKINKHLNSLWRLHRKTNAYLQRAEEKHKVLHRKFEVDNSSIQHRTNCSHRAMPTTMYLSERMKPVFTVFYNMMTHSLFGSGDCSRKARKED